jgi:hypothetical protein
MFCLYFVLLLFVITVSLYAWLSGVNSKTLDIWKEINCGLVSLFSFGMLFHICNYAHNFANIVRYQKTLYEHMYGAFRLYYSLECKSRSFEKIMPPGTKCECSILADFQSSNTVRTVTKFSCALGKIL